MKWINAFILAIGMSSLFGVQVLHADMIPPGGPIPERRAEEAKPQRRSIPPYAIGAGIVAVALTGSLVALRWVRKRNGN
jgi:hypothetical protein